MTSRYEASSRAKPTVQKGTYLDGIAWILLLAYLTGGGLLFRAFVEPSLNGLTQWRAYGDSDVYMSTAEFIRNQDNGAAILALLSVTRSVVLPALVALLFSTPSDIVIFNLFLFLFALYLLGKTYPDLKWWVFLPVILLSGTTYESIFTLNKEIFVFLSTVLLLRWFKTHSLTLLLAILIISAALRWEQALVVALFWIVFRTRASPRLAVIVLIAGVTITYPLAINWVMIDLPVQEQDKSSSALYALLNQGQSYGLYPFVFWFKFAIALTSQVIRFWQPFTDPQRIHDLNNGLYVMLDQICLSSVLIMLSRKRHLSMRSPVMLFSSLYLVVFLAAPMNQPRYLYMLLIMVAVFLSSTDLASIRILPDRARNGNPRLLPV